MLEKYMKTVDVLTLVEVEGKRNIFTKGKLKLEDT